MPHKGTVLTELAEAPEQHLGMIIMELGAPKHIEVLHHRAALIKAKDLRQIEAIHQGLLPLAHQDLVEITEVVVAVALEVPETTYAAPVEAVQEVLVM
ncbi:MAG: hypothetical protein ACJAQ7_002350 [Sediminicola sp.]|jgi:hypothetical protein